MNPKCIQAVTAAAGKPMSAGKLKAIEDGMGAKMRELARLDRTRWQGLTHEQRMIEAATELAHDIVGQAALKEARDTMQVLRTAETEARISDHRGLHDLTRSQGWIRDMELTQPYIDDIRNRAVGHLQAMMDAAATKDGTGTLRRLGMAIFDLDNPTMTADVVREVFKGADGHTGNAAAKAGARAWLDTIEGLRVRFNGAGGDVGKLGYGYLSQHHDQVKIEKAGAAVWADKVLPLLDREQYVEADGTLTPVDKVRDMLLAAHETLATGGDNKTAPGAFKGSGARANRGSDVRVLHFRDGDAWMAYMRDFGEGSLYDAMLGHVGRMSRDIGLVERYGPNPEQQARVQNDIAQREDGQGTKANRSFGTVPETRWALLNGSAATPYNPTVAAWGEGARNSQTAAKLGGAVISSLTDMGSIAQTLQFNRLPYFEYLSNLRAGMDKATKRELEAHGIIGEAMADTLNRWTGEHLTHGVTGRMAAATMKLSLMNAWSDGLRRAFTMTHMSAWARKLGRGWGDLSEWDRYLMQRKGITEADWGVITKAQATDVNGHSFLTPAGVQATGVDGAQQIATKWGAFLSDEAQFAVINPDQATRAVVTGGGMPRGTVNGEAIRAFWQFKSFPMAMVSRHWRRIGETPQGLEGAPMGYGGQTAGSARANRIAMFAAMNVSLMLLGAGVMQVKALLSGKDPMNMDPQEEHGRKFWQRALAQGGGLSFVGDFLMQDTTSDSPFVRRGELVGGALAGPVGGAVGGLAWDLIKTNIDEVANGKDSHLGAETLRWVNSQLPGASLWQIRQVWQREVIDQAQEMLAPGYLARMKRRAQKDFGTSWYWGPGENLPDRLPDFSTVAGQ